MKGIYGYISKTGHILSGYNKPYESKAGNRRGGRGTWKG